MELLILIGILLESALYLALLLMGGPALRKHSQYDVPSEGWPPVTMIVPAAGVSPGTSRCLDTLLSQDYGNYQVIFSTCDESDPATHLIREKIKDVPEARLICAGVAEKCGQKNHNLLSAIKEVDDRARILVFCDSTHYAAPGFLKALVAPIVLGAARVTSGYHHVVPQDGGFVVVSRAIAVLILYLTKGIPLLNQPWGGATAIDRDLFGALCMEATWASSVVDDVTMARRLVRAGIRTALAPDAHLASFPQSDTLKSYTEWLYRQWFYLKFSFPYLWVLAGLNQHFVLGLVLISLASFVGLISGWTSLNQAICASVFLMLVAGYGLALRAFHPNPGSSMRWLGALFLTIALASWTHFQTVVSRTLRWKGIQYRVDGEGLVTAIKRVEGTPR